MNVRAHTTLYHLALLKRAGVSARPRKRIPKQRYPKLIEAEYARALISQLSVANLALTELFSRLAELVQGAQAARKLDRRDAGESDELAAIMARVRARLAQAVDPVSVKELAQKFAERTQTAQRIALGAQVKAALGADVFSADKRIPAIRDQFVGENVSLIKSIPTQVLSEVEGVVGRAFTSATPHDVLVKQINERFSVGESRARLIARDQIGKLYGQTNAYRQQDLGITSFIWRTSGDERVRDEHAALEGLEFNYPEGAPGEGIPGEPFQCRCSAEPVFKDLLSAPEPEPSIEAPPEVPRESARGPLFRETEPEVPRAIGRAQEIQQAQQRLVEQRAAREAARVEHDRLVAESQAAEKAIQDLVAQHHAELMSAHEGFRIGVSSEITGNELPQVTPSSVKFAPSPYAHTPLPPPVTVPTHELSHELPAPQSANVQLHIPAPVGFTGVSHEGDIYYRHNVSGRAYTPEQHAEKQAGKGVILTGPNHAPNGFEIIEKSLREGGGDIYRSQKSGNTYTLEEISRGYAAETDKLLLEHEVRSAKKPGLLKRLAHTILGSDDRPARS